jgi:ATP-binding cassette subfamily F protein uup
MPAPLLSLQDIMLGFGGHPLLDGADLVVEPGDRLCLVGRNGSGKSTLLKVAAGLLPPDRGRRVPQQSIDVRYLPQEPDLSGHATVLDYVAAGLPRDASDHRARALLDALGLAADLPAATLSGGEIRRAALARILAPKPDVLLLDEPTNHLDLPAIEWLERELADLPSAIVLISHDRRFLERLSRATLWLDRGRVRRLNQGFGAFEAWRDEMLEQEEKDRHKLDRRIVAEEHWLRYGVTARRKRNEKRLARLQGLRQERREERRRTGQVQMTAGEAPQSGKLVIEAKGLAKAFAAEPLIRDLSLRVRRGDRLGIVGPNGAGKTTLLKLLTGQLEPDAGEVKLGANLLPVTLDQQRRALDPAWTLVEALTGGHGDRVQVGGQSRHVMSYLQDFLFTPAQANTPVGVLSGGERGRLMLARALAQPANLLVLDEPTNDLDLETLDLLQELIDEHPATVVLVSHDRDFIDRVCTSVLAFEGKGRWQEYPGGYSDMVVQRGGGVTALRAGNAARRPPPPRPETPRAERRTRLSQPQQQALRDLPRRMETLQKGIATLQEKLHDPDLFRRDPAGFAKASTDLATLQAALAAAEDEWLELSLLKEELEG